MTSWPTWSSQNWFSGTIWQWGCPFPRLCSWKCLCSWKYAKAQELPRLNRSSMHNLATGTFIFCRALESILSSSSSDPGVCQVPPCSLKAFPGQSDNGTVHWTAKVVHFCSLISRNVSHIELDRPWVQHSMAAQL